MNTAISINSLCKTYDNGFVALDNVNLDIQKGEIFALLGPNGAGKTTLIGSVCGIVKTTAGTISVMGHDHQKEYRKARDKIGLVPQELTTDAFESVWNVTAYSRGLFGKPRNDAYIKEILESLSLWDKKDTQIRKLSGGMKRRVLIAKALAHEPEVLFLDEPSAGVDVELRKSMWRQIRRLRENGTTIILTTHYIEEAEEMADRIGIINNGKLMLVEDKNSLMKKLGKKELVLDLYKPITLIPESLSEFNLLLSDKGDTLTFNYDPSKDNNGIADLLDCLKESGIKCKDLSTKQSSLEDIFVTLVGGEA